MDRSQAGTSVISGECGHVRDIPSFIYKALSAQILNSEKAFQSWETTRAHSHHVWFLNWTRHSWLPQPLINRRIWKPLTTGQQLRKFVNVWIWNRIQKFAGVSRGYFFQQNCWKRLSKTEYFKAFWNDRECGCKPHPLRPYQLSQNYHRYIKSNAKRVGMQWNDQQGNYINNTDSQKKPKLTDASRK